MKPAGALAVADGVIFPVVGVTVRGWKALAGSAIGYAMDGFDLLIVSFILPAISADLVLTSSVDRHCLLEDRCQKFEGGAASNLALEDVLVSADSAARKYPSTISLCNAVTAAQSIASHVDRGLGRVG